MKNAKPFILAAVFAVFALSACNNVVSTEKKKSTSKIVSGVSGVEGEAAVTVTSVRNKTLYVPTNTKDGQGNAMIGADPYAVYELRTDGKNSLLDLCVQPGANGYCRCIYQYEDNSQERIDARNVFGFESNVAYCPVDVYGSLAQLQVGIQLGDSTITNLVVANQDIPQDATTNPGFYVQAQRHQCYPSTDLTYLFDPEMMNPIESYDPRHVTNLNYYVTNAADTIRLFSLQSSLYAKSATWQGRAQFESFHCPTLMGYWDDTTSAGRGVALNSGLQAFSSAKYRDWFRGRWLNEVIFSQAADTSDVSANNAKGLVMHDPRPVKPSSSSYIKPESNSDPQYRQLSNNSRTNFHLSKFQTSLFSVPVSAMRFPDTSNTSQRCTSDDQKNCVRAAGVIGYGAPTEAKGTNPEACPDVALLPSGWTWKKLFQFIGTGPARVRVKESAADLKNGLGLFQLGTTLCNPGIKNDSSKTKDDLIYPECATRFSGLLCPKEPVKFVANNDGTQCLQESLCKGGSNDSGPAGAFKESGGCSQQCPFGQALDPTKKYCTSCKKVADGFSGYGSEIACDAGSGCQLNSFAVVRGGNTYCTPLNEFITGSHASLQNQKMFGGARPDEVIQSSSPAGTSGLSDRVFANQKMCVGFVDEYNQAGYHSTNPDYTAKAKAGRAGGLRQGSYAKYTEENALSGLDLYVRSGGYRETGTNWYKSDFLFLNSIWVDPFKVVNAIYAAIISPKPVCNGGDCSLANIKPVPGSTPADGPEKPRFTPGIGPISTNHIENEAIDSSGLYVFNDYLFVVTPETVLSDELFNGDGDLKKYWPSRIRSKEGCAALFANAATWGSLIDKASSATSSELKDCLINYKPLVSPTDLSGKSVNYPVCVPQAPLPQ